MHGDITTICGSMRYYNQMLALANELTLEGEIVLMPFVLKVNAPGMDESLQELHRRKIEMSDNVYIFAGVEEQMGESTHNEYINAKERGKNLFIYKGFPAVGKQDDWIIE